MHYLPQTAAARRLAMRASSIAISSVLLASPVAHAQLQSPAQAKCLSLLSKRVAKLVKVQGKEIDACVEDLANGIGNSFSCLTVDSKGRIAKAAAKLVDAEATACGAVPDFGYLGSSALIAAATAHRIALDEWTTTLSQLSPSSAPCVRLFLKGATKLLGKKLSGFNECLEKGLADASIQSGADLVGCFSVFDSSNDAQLSKLLASLASQLDNKHCAGQLAFCFVEPELCAEQATSCRACETLRIGGGLTADCELLDNGMADNSCSSACGDGELGTLFGFPEECDDGNRVSADGCDSNCTASGCGNGLPAGGEFCDALYGSDLGGVCVGGIYDGSACTVNAECDGGYCTNCPWRLSCAADCGSCETPICTPTGPSECTMLTGFCIGQSCLFIPVVACDDPACGTAGNCTIDGYCVPTDAVTCAEYEGVLGSCTLGL
jgi:cysteine-rich repeat protein